MSGRPGQDLQFSEVDQNSQRMGVLTAVIRLVLGHIAMRILLAPSRKIVIDHITVAADYGDLHAAYRKDIARFRRDALVLPGCQHLLIRIPNLHGGAAGFRVDVFAMIKKRPHRNSLHKLRNPSRMIVVIVGQQHIVNPVDTREFGGRDDSVGIAALIIWPAGIDQK